MYRGNTVGIVVASYNEGGFVGDVLREIPAYVDRVYAIDDCSTDGTWEEICQVAREQADGAVETTRVKAKSDGGDDLHTTQGAELDTGRVVALQHDVNRGAGGAIKTGYLAARRDGLGVNVTIDEDGQMDLSHLPRLLDPIVDGEAGYTKGNRLATEETRVEMPLFRLAGNIILTALTRAASGYWDVTDSQNGYTAISSEALCRLDITSLYDYYGYCNDLLVKLNMVGISVVDVAMPAVYGNETSSINYGAYIARISQLLIYDAVWRVWRTHGK